MTAIFYGSTTGTTEALARRIAEKLGVPSSDLYNVADTPAGKSAGYDLLLLGSSTWGDGELQDDWYDFLDQLKKCDLAGKRVALFGCGDAESYPDTFCDALGLIREGLAGSGCTFTGAYPAAGYPVKDSRAFDGDRVIGLAADQDNDAGATAARIDQWIKAIG